MAYVGSKSERYLLGGKNEGEQEGERKGETPQ